MRQKLLWLALAAAAVSIWLAAKVEQTLPVMAGAQGARSRMLIAGKSGPVVVIEAFGEMQLDFWGTIQWRCAEFSRVVTYDHRGTGGSDPGSKPRDARQIATELHDMLHAARLDPPYILAGYSFGGPYVRVFADLFPQEVSGLVLIDPSQEEFFDWLKVHRPDLNRITPEQEAEQGEYGCSWRSLNHARMARVPKVPVILISAMRPFGEHDPRLRPEWLKAHKRWVSQVPGAEHIVTERSDHGIIWEEPDLVVKTIQKVVNRVTRPRGMRAVDRHYQSHTREGGSWPDVTQPLCYALAVAEKLTKEKLLHFLVRLGASARTPGACFITGGGSALLLGWRETTIDVDLKFDPEPAGVFDAIPALKRELSINVELASPADFIPPLADWRERSRSIGRYGKLQVYHYDFLSQALSKLERGHAKDLLDVTEMLRLRLVRAEDLVTHAEAIRPQLKRYPALDEESFMRRVKEFLAKSSHV